MIVESLPQICLLHNQATMTNSFIQNRRRADQQANIDTWACAACMRRFRQHQNPSPRSGRPRFRHQSLGFAILLQKPTPTSALDFSVSAERLWPSTASPARRTRDSALPATSLTTWPGTATCACPGFLCVPVPMCLRNTRVIQRHQDDLPVNFSLLSKPAPVDTA